MSVLFGDLDALGRTATTFSAQGDRLASAGSFMPSSVPASTLSGEAASALNELLSSFKDELAGSASALQEAGTLVGSLRERLEILEDQFLDRKRRADPNFDPIVDLVGVWLFGEPEYVAGRSVIEGTQTQLRALAQRASLSRFDGFTAPGEGKDPDWINSTFSSEPVGQFVGGFIGGIYGAGKGIYDTVTDPVGTAKSLVEFGQYAIHDPGAAFNQIVNVDDLRDNFPRWLGGYASAVALFAAGAGAATKVPKLGRFATDSVKRTAEAARAAIRAADGRFVPSPSVALLERIAGKSEAAAKRLTNIFNGVEFNRYMGPKNYGKLNEIRLTLPDGRTVILDSYVPGKRIVSRKYTQLNEVSPNTAKHYIDELREKYAPDRGVVQDVPKSRSDYSELIGSRLKGDLYLEVPVQNGNLASEQFRQIIEYAKGPPRVTIVNEFGKVYNPL